MLHIVVYRRVSGINNLLEIVEDQRGLDATSTKDHPLAGPVKWRAVGPCNGYSDEDAQNCCCNLYQPAGNHSCSPGLLARCCGCIFTRLARNGGVTPSFLANRSCLCHDGLGLSLDRDANLHLEDQGAGVWQAVAGPVSMALQSTCTSMGWWDSLSWSAICQPAWHACHVLVLA